MNAAMHGVAMTKKLVLVFVLLFVIVNLLAYRHARAFFFYTSGSERTPAPELLGWADKARVLMTGIRVPKPVAHALPSDAGLPYEIIRIPVDGHIDLPAWRIPRPDAHVVVMLFHGYSSEKSGLLPEARRFHDLGHEVIMVDFPGHGDAPGHQTSLGIREAATVAAVVEWMRKQAPARTIMVYGHSMGGAAAMRAVARHGAKPDGMIVESVFDDLLQAIRFRFALMSVPSFPLAEMLLFWGSVQLGANGFEHDVVAYARQVDVPVLVAHGGHDRRAPVAGARAVYDALPGKKDWLLIEAAGHVNPCLADEARWSGAVREFIERVADGDSD